MLAYKFLITCRVGSRRGLKTWCWLCGLRRGKKDETIREACEGSCGCSIIFLWSIYSLYSRIALYFTLYVYSLSYTLIFEFDVIFFPVILLSVYFLFAVYYILQ